MNEPLANEAELVEQAKSDDQAFETLYDHYFPKIYGYLMKRLGNQATTEDLVSETFLNVFCKLKNYENRGYSFGAWLYRIATNNLVDYYRKQGRRLEVALDPEFDIKSDSLSSEEALIKTEDQTKILLILTRLKPKQQKVLYLKFFADKDYEEIAEILGKSLNTTRVYLHRALKKFNKIYQEYGK